jgi:hypothetical protein
MNTFTAKRTTLLALGTAALLSIGATAVANAQDFTVPNTDIRALEPPIDVTPNQLRAQGTPVYQGGPYYQGRSSSDGVVQQLFAIPRDVLR